MFWNISFYCICKIANATKSQKFPGQHQHDFLFLQLNNNKQNNKYFDITQFYKCNCNHLYCIQYTTVLVLLSLIHNIICAIYILDFLKMSRKCLNDPDKFCYVCGNYTLKTQRRSITNDIKKLYRYYFDVHLGDQDKSWAPHQICSSCSNGLRDWFNKKKPLCHLLYQ